jgi:hypothetical protein
MFREPGLELGGEIGWAVLAMALLERKELNKGEILRAAGMPPLAWTTH